jgi:zinc protease
MITRGCGSRDAAAVADRADRLGGSLGGVAGRNSFGLAAEWLAKSWHDGFDLVADCILDPSLAADELKREQRQLADDQISLRDNPTQVVFRVFSEALYGAHPYARDVLGTESTIGALDPTALAAFYRDIYPVSNLTLAIVGDVDVDDVVTRVTRRFGKRTGGSRVRVGPALPNFDGRSDSEREVYRYLDRAQSHLVVGFPGATVDAKDRFALEVLVAVLGGQSGRLFGELRDKQGLVYRVSAHSIEGVDPGFVAIYLSCSADKLDAALRGVRGELTRLRDAGITAEELARAQRYLIGSHQIAMQRRSAVANAMAYHEAYGLGWQSYAAYDDAIQTVTSGEVAAAAKTYLRADRAITATVRPPTATPAADKKSRIAPPSGPIKAPPKRRSRRGTRRNA